jgi:hypothetical protein
MTPGGALKRPSMSLATGRGASQESEEHADLQEDRAEIGVGRDVPAHAFKAATLDRYVTPPGLYSSQIATQSSP